MTASTSPLPCIAIAGPTASGKTNGALALAAVLAQRGQASEIISVDSALVYRGMDIGTAKPTPEEQAAVPHHLIDIIDPLQSYSAAEFVQDTQRLVAEIRARGAIPLLVGGTMLYFKALLDGIDEMPAADPEVRAKLDAQAAEIGWPAMHNWPRWTLKPQPAWHLAIASAFSVRWRSGMSPASHCRAFIRQKRELLRQDQPSIARFFPWNPMTVPGCMHALLSAMRAC